MEAGDAEAGINQQVAVAAAYVPDIALHEPDCVRLPDARDVIRDPIELEPALRYREAHGL
jgi:hypothetical protein